MEAIDVEQELQELRIAVATLVEQLRIQNELLAAKDAQISALTEKNRFWKSNIRGTSRTMTN